MLSLIKLQLNAYHFGSSSPSIYSEKIKGDQIRVFYSLHSTLNTYIFHINTFDFRQK